jgi:hypothetical protein
MKKKIIGGIALLAIVAVAAWNMDLNSQSDKLSAVSLANVEALAQSEVEDIGCNKEYDEVCVKINNKEVKGRRH